MLPVFFCFSSSFPSKSAMFRKSPNTSGRFNRQARCSLASRNRRRSIQRTPLTFERFEDRQLLATFAEFVDPHPSSGNRFGQSVVPLETGNVVITSPADDAGGTDAGAVYLFNGSTGALISTLTGSSPSDLVGSTGVVALEGGNYVVRSSACLLYTSPSPRDRQKSRMPSSA